MCDIGASLAKIRCPSCFAEFRRRNASYLCRSRSVVADPCEAFVDEAELRNIASTWPADYRKNAGVDLSCLISCEGEWGGPPPPTPRRGPVRYRQMRWFGNEPCPRCGGKSRYRACPNCGREIISNVFDAKAISRVTVGVVGFKGDGKSCLQMAWTGHVRRVGVMLQSDQVLDKRADWCFHEPSVEAYLPQRNAGLTHPLVLQDRPKNRQNDARHLYLHDVSGEDVERLMNGVLGAVHIAPDDPLHAVSRLLRRADRLCVVVDPTKASSYNRLGAVLPHVGIERNHHHVKPLHRIAICVVKIDSLFSPLPSTPPAPDDLNKMAKRLIDQFGVGLYNEALALVDGNPNRVGVFGISALGQVPLPASQNPKGYTLSVQSPLRPWGIEDLLKWLW